MKLRRPSRIAIVALLAALAPTAAEACAVCFGKTDSPLGKGLHWGVFALLAFIVAMLGAFAGFAVFLARRSLAVQREEEDAAALKSGGKA